MSVFYRSELIDAGPGGDTIKQAVLDLDTDLDGLVAAYNAHDAATTDIHGLGSGTVVGTTNTQTLTLKTLSAPTLTGVVNNSGGTITGGTVSGVTLTGTVTASGATLLSPAITGPTLHNPTLTGTIIGAMTNPMTTVEDMIRGGADGEPARIAIGEQQVVGRLTGGSVKGLSVAELQGLIYSAAMQLIENAPIMLDAALSEDGKYSGITRTGTAGETVAFGELLYFKAADSKWYKAKADATATSGAVHIGMCVVGGDASDTIRLLTYGNVRADAKFPSMTISAPVFVSAATAGAVTSTAPSGTTNYVVRIIGHAITADELFFNPSPDYAELS